MRLRQLMSLAWKALVINTGRSVLTMLGMVIGIMSVILMIGVGQSAQNYLLSQVASFGSDLVFISNGKGDEMRGGPPSASVKQTLTVADVKKLESLGWVKGVDGYASNRDVVSYGGRDHLTQVAGVSPDDPLVFNEVVSRGGFLTRDDIDGHARAVVLGSKLVAELFGEEDPIGRTIKIARQPFKVIGTLRPAGARFFSDTDDQVFVPFSAVLDLYHRNRLNFIAVKAGSVRPSEAKELVRIALRDTHGINNPGNVLSKDDFRVATQADAIKSVNTIGGILQILLASIASISLVVAGVGIMNIMYVTVTERTREIGLRKAIGATRSDILRQFLCEALLMTGSAGVIGTGLGILVNWLAIVIIARWQNGWFFTVPWFGAALACGVSAAIGVIFGYFPARAAAGLRPIQALRYE